MSPVRRLISEYSDLAQTLSPADYFFLLVETVKNVSSIRRTRSLFPVDRAMSRDMTVRFGHSRITVPIQQIDRILAPLEDNPTFGNVREIYARNCYLRHLYLDRPVRAVLDLGANRGMFSLLALIDLGAEVVVGVEPHPQYDQIFKILLEANQCTKRRAPRYLRLVGSSARERSSSREFVSIATILREQSIERFDLVKMDIEGERRNCSGNRTGSVESII